MTDFYSRVETTFKGNRIFSVPFPFLDENDIAIYIDNVLTKNWEWLNDSQIMLNGNIIMGADIVIQRKTPINVKVVDYKNTSMVLNDENLNKSQDQLLYSVQEIYDNTEKNTENTNLILNSMESIIQLADETVKQAEEQVQRASEFADISKEYAQQIEYGVRWTPFSIDNWTAEEDKYVMTFSEMSLIVLDVYKITNGVKEKIVNIDVEVSDNKVTVTSPEAFDGGILTASKTIGNYIHEQEVPANEWVIYHNLGKHPQITVTDLDGFVQYGKYQYVSLNEIRLIFENEITGYVYLN